MDLITREYKVVLFTKRIETGVEIRKTETEMVFARSIDSALHITRERIGILAEDFYNMDVNSDFYYRILSIEEI